MFIRSPLAISLLNRSTLALAILVLALAGCSDTDAFHYTYTGRLLDQQENAAAGVDLYVTDQSGFNHFHGNEWERDFWTYWGTRTDEDGRFIGKFNGEGTYSKWLGIVPPVSPPAKVLDVVYVVVFREGEWLPILVQLEQG
jgi:hypothetical protein